MAKRSAQKADPKWQSAAFWNAAEYNKKPHEIIQPLIAQIREDQANRYESYRVYAQEYGIDMSQLGEPDTDISAFSEEIEQNELANSVETLHAQLFKTKVVPAFSTSEASFEEHERGIAASRWMEGVFREARVHAIAVPEVGTDMLIYGTGFFRIGHEKDDDEYKITVSRASARNVYVDRLESRHGNPRTIHVKTNIDRFLLLEEYGKESDGLFGTAEERYEAISNAPGNDDDDIRAGVPEHRGDMVTVWETWHLPDGSGKNGRYCVTIKNCTLIDREYKRKRFPLVRMKFNLSLGGYYGESAVKRLLPLQRAFTKLVKRIDRAHDLLGVPRLIVRDGSGLEPAHLDDVEGSVLVVKGDPMSSVREWNAQPITPDAYQERNGLPDRMRGTLGISQFQANAGLPAQMRDVGSPFLERMVDQGAARHAMNHEQYEQAMIDVGEVILDEAEELQSCGKSVVAMSPVKGKMKHSFTKLSFSDIKVDRKNMVLFVQSASGLPQTFAGKVDALSKVSQIPPEMRGLLEVPDIAQSDDLASAPSDIVKKTLDTIVRKKRYLAPMPWDNLIEARVITLNYIGLYRVKDDYDDDVYDMLVKFLEDIDALQKPNPPPDNQMPDGMPALPDPGALPPMPGGQMPGAMPGMPPPVPEGLPVGDPNMQMPF